MLTSELNLALYVSALIGDRVDFPLASDLDVWPVDAIMRIKGLSLYSKVRALHLDTELAKNIPGGPRRYVEILAAQLESRRGLLAATAEYPATADQAATSLAAGAAALIRWWHVHRYVGAGKKGDPFQWRFLREDQVRPLREHANQCAAFGPGMITQAAGILASENLLQFDEASQRLSELTSTA